MSTDLDTYFTTAIRLTKEAGEVIKKAWTQKKNVVVKSSAVDLVTETDQQVEKLLIAGFKKEFPGHKFIGEESTAAAETARCDLTNDPTWIIDPVDGTMNFVHGFPCIAISIALAVDKQTVIGIIYNPIMDQLFTAQLGKGSFLNGNQINVSKQDDILKALVIFEVGNARDDEKLDCVFNNLRTLMPVCHGLRTLGSAALDMCHVAAGYADAYFEFGVHCWDIAAGDIIVREAGGSVIDTDGGPVDLMSRRFVCAATEKLSQDLAQKIKKLTLKRDDAD